MTPVSLRTVEQLVQAAGQGDEKAWAAIVDRYTQLVWSVARRQGLSASSADDVVQTTWLKLAENIEKIRDPSRLSGWLATTARNAAMDVHRKSTRIDLYDSVPENPSLDSEIETPLLDSERDQSLWQAFRSLTAKCQEILGLMAADPDLSYEEIGVILQMPHGSIGPTRRRCLEALQNKPGIKDLRHGIS